MARKTENLSQYEIWLLAARPKTLPAAAAPVIVGSAVAFYDGSFRVGPALAALFGALLLQIGANLANDVFDFHRGADTVERLGPARVTQSGLLSPAQVLSGMWVCFGLATIMGVYLTAVAGWPVVLIGAASILAAIAYTGGPIPLGYYGLGDLTVFLFFGPVAVCGTYYVQAGDVGLHPILSSLPMGFLITAILVVNNLRDIETDRAAGKRTLAVRLGESATRWEFLLLIVGAYLVAMFMVLFRVTPFWVLLSWLSTPLAASMVRDVWREKGRPLNSVLAGTGRLTLVFALLFALGLIVSRLLSESVVN